jgi:hypothetical protein
MSIHSLPSTQLNKARVVAILTPHLTTRAACILGRLFSRFYQGESLLQAFFAGKNSSESNTGSIETR